MQNYATISDYDNTNQYGSKDTIRVSSRDIYDKIIKEYFTPATDRDSKVTNDQNSSQASSIVSNHD